MIIIPGSVTLTDLQKIFQNDLSVKLCPSVRNKIDQSAILVKEASSSGIPTYGINTGFGKLATKTIGFKDIEKQNVYISTFS